MKKILFLIVTLVFTSISFAQAPQKMSYQAVIRNASNVLISNTSVGMRISILQNSPTGTAVYVETQTATTNANGLATLQIGNGAIVLGTFSTINWGADNYYIKTETDLTGGTNYTITGTSQLLSVPYALYAGSTAPSNGWSLNGNIGTNAGTNFLGTTDDVDLVFKRNNTTAGFINTNNLAFGLNTLPSSTGAGNTAIGNLSLSNNSTGYANVALGNLALSGNTTGYSNAAFGNYSLMANGTGSINAATGNSALSKNTTGSGNTSNGFASLFNNTTGFSNTAIGQASLYNNVSGNSNVALGSSALDQVTGNNNIGVGSGAQVPTASGNDQMSIANVIYGADLSSTATGKIGIGVPVPTEKLEVAGKTKTTDLQITNNAAAGKLLTSDASGNATWSSNAPGTVAGVYPFNGMAGGPFVSMTGYSFVGPTATITITSSTQKIYGSAVAPLATATGSVTDVLLGLGYQLVPSGGVTNFVGFYYAAVTIDTTRSPQAVSGYVTGLAPGTYYVGVVIYNPYATSISNNDFVNGWVMVTN